jgi:protein-tyrosine-phosphatase
VEFKSLRSVLAVKVVDAMELGLTVEVDSSAGVGEKVDEKVNEKADSVLEESDRASDSDGSEKGVDRSRR